MGKRKPKEPKVQKYQLQTIKQNQQIGAEAQSALEQIKQQSAQTIEDLNRRNAEALGLINNQLRQTEEERDNYKQKLQDYLNQLSNLRQSYATALSEKDAILDRINTQQQNEAMSNQLMSSLLSTSTLAKRKFLEKTRKRRGLIV
jgi:chromosome segregation ATPase